MQNQHNVPKTLVLADRHFTFDFIWGTQFPIYSFGDQDRFQSCESEHTNMAVSTSVQNCEILLPKRYVHARRQPASKDRDYDLNWMYVRLGFVSENRLRVPALCVFETL